MRMTLGSRRLPLECGPPPSMEPISGSAAFACLERPNLLCVALLSLRDLLISR
jgi:hypothetical protein